MAFNYRKAHLITCPQGKQNQINMQNQGNPDEVVEKLLDRRGKKTNDRMTDMSKTNKQQTKQKNEIKNVFK